MNEHQVGISESTCSAVYAAKSVSNGGFALLSINALSQIAMERAKTAREAVQIMGDLSEQYGFYGASASFEGGGASLIVTDANEGWVFHILADPTGKCLSCAVLYCTYTRCTYEVRRGRIYGMSYSLLISPYATPSSYPCSYLRSCSTHHSSSLSQGNLLFGWELVSPMVTLLS